MNTIKFLAGFTVGSLFTYLVGSLIAWDLNPGNWNFMWRLFSAICLIFWGWIIGLVFKDVLFVKKTSNVVTINQRR